MFELVNKLNVILNELKGFEAGYSTANLSVLCIKSEENMVYRMEIKEIGKKEHCDMMHELGLLRKGGTSSTFKIVKKLVNVLELFKAFNTGYTTSSQDIFLMEYNDVLFKVEISELDEGEIHTYLK